MIDTSIYKTDAEMLIIDNSRCSELYIGDFVTISSQDIYPTDIWASVYCRRTNKYYCIRLVDMSPLLNDKNDNINTFKLLKI